MGGRGIWLNDGGMACSQMVEGASGQRRGLWLDEWGILSNGRHMVGWGRTTVRM